MSSIITLNYDQPYSSFLQGAQSKYPKVNVEEVLMKYNHPGWTALKQDFKLNPSRMLYGDLAARLEQAIINSIPKAPAEPVKITKPVENLTPVLQSVAQPAAQPPVARPVAQPVVQPPLVQPQVARPVAQPVAQPVVAKNNCRSALCVALAVAVAASAYVTNLYLNNK